MGLPARRAERAARADQPGPSAGRSAKIPSRRYVRPHMDHERSLGTVRTAAVAWIVLAPERRPLAGWPDRAGRAAAMAGTA